MMFLIIVGIIIGLIRRPDATGGIGKLAVIYFLAVLPVLVILTAEGRYIEEYFRLIAVVGGDDVVRKKILVLVPTYAFMVQTIFVLGAPQKQLLLKTRKSVLVSMARRRGSAAYPT
jgi:hypothetical protein